MARSIRKGRKGLSPVISTIIIVAIAIAVAIAVAYWMVGITAAFTKFERLEVTSSYADVVSAGVYNITVSIKNTGSAPATVDIIFINGRICDLTLLSADGNLTVELSDVDHVLTFETLETTGPTALTEPFSLDPGEAITLYISNDGAGIPFVSGVNLDIVIHTGAGKEYPKAVPLP